MENYFKIITLVYQYKKKIKDNKILKPTWVHLTRSFGTNFLNIRLKKNLCNNMYVVSLNLFQKLLGITQVKSSLQDSVIKCTFYREINVGTDQNQIFSLTQKWYMLFAHGAYSASTGKKHHIN